MFLSSLLLLACGDKDGDDSGVDANIVLLDEHNFRYEGDVTVPNVVTASGQDLTICWDQVQANIQCHELDPIADLDNIGLARFPNKTQAEVEQGISLNTLLQADIDGYVEWNMNHSDACVQLSEFSFFGTPIDVPSEYTYDGGTYMLMLTEGLEPGINAKVITFIEPRQDSTNTRVDVPDSCGLLDFEATLTDLEPLVVPADGPWVLDWSSLTHDGINAPLLLSSIDRLMIAFYEGQTPAELQERFLDLEIIIDRSWEMELPGGTTADLSEATGPEGAFPGFEGDGTWLLALFCGRCYNPAPVFLTVVQPEG